MTIDGRVLNGSDLFKFGYHIQTGDMVKVIWIVGD
jgi:hypothetical protein